MAKKTAMDEDLEFAAMRLVYEALEPLSEEARERVLGYVSRRLDIRGSDDGAFARKSDPGEDTSSGRQAQGDESGETGGPLDGVSPVAVKWMKRSGVAADDLSKVFSISLDEIDLVTSNVPGSSKRVRLHNVFRLSAMAAYLSTGAARVSAEDLKEACQHYDAYDAANHAKNLKALGREISGTKESGYTLSPTGITSATKLIKDMIGESS